MTIYVATTAEGATLQKKYRKYRSALDRVRLRIRLGFGLCISIAILNLLLGVWIFNYATPDRHQLGAFLLVNVIVFFSLGLGILISDRFCAMATVAYLTIQIFVLAGMGLLPFPLLIIAAIFIVILSQTTIGTIEYRKLMNKEQFFQAYLKGERKLEIIIVDNSELLDSQIKYSDSQPPQKISSQTNKTRPKSIGSTIEREQLIPCPELIQLCNGDENQATWLLSQIRAKDPHRSLEYYNAMAIGQIRDEMSGMLDR